MPKCKTCKNYYVNCCKTCRYVSKMRQRRDARYERYVRPCNKNGVILFIDTETNGLPIEIEKFLSYDPRSCIRAYDDSRLLSMAYSITNGGKVISEYYAETTDELPISDFIKELTGLTGRNGTVSTKDMIMHMMRDVKKHGATHVVAHNAEFDRNIILSEMLRNGIDVADWLNMKFRCTMLKTDYKSLSFCIENILGKKDATGLHNAKTDMDFCRKLFFEIND